MLEISEETTSDTLREVFSQYGTVESCNVNIIYTLQNIDGIDCYRQSNWTK